MTITEAAQVLGVSRQAVQDAISRDRLKIVLLFGKRLVTRESVAAYTPRAYTRAKGRERNKGERR